MWVIGIVAAVIVVTLLFVALSAAVFLSPEDDSEPASAGVSRRS